MKQLIIVADMEGASGIFDSNREACWHEELYPQNTLWRSYGRDCITSDVLAVCNAAIEMGIDDILLYDMHFAGCKEYNVQIEKLPSIVRTSRIERGIANPSVNTLNRIAQALDAKLLISIA